MHHIIHVNCTCIDIEKNDIVDFAKGGLIANDPYTKL